MTYLIAIGHNNTTAWGTPDPQPKSPGMAYGRRTLAANGLEYEDGFRSTIWHWGYMTLAQKTAFEAQAGLGEGTLSAPVTISTTRNSDRTFDVYNATILMPEIPDSGGLFEYTVWHDVEYRLIRLEEI
jgi:hypothetical protein